MHLPLSPKLSTHVAEPLMPILCSMLATVTSFELAERAVVLRADLGHDEQRQSLGAGGGAVDAREHEVDDVLGEIVVAAAR